MPYTLINIYIYIYVLWAIGMEYQTMYTLLGQFGPARDFESRIEVNICYNNTFTIFY